MPDDGMRSSVLLVTTSNKTAELFRNALARRQFASAVIVKSAGAARRIMTDSPADMIIIDTPLSDDIGLQLAADMADKELVGVLLLVNTDQYEQLYYAAAEKGILVLPKPIDGQMAYQAASLLHAAGIKLRRLKRKTETLEIKMNEIRLVNRAKLILVEQLGMSEADAHRYIEKSAMDRCVKRREIAEGIINNARHTLG